MPRRSRDRVALADAEQELRLLRNKLHNLDQDTVLPLRVRIAELEHDHGQLITRAERDAKMRDLYRAAWESMLDLVQALASGKAP